MLILSSVGWTCVCRKSVQVGCCTTLQRCTGASSATVQTVSSVYAVRCTLFPSNTVTCRCWILPTSCIVLVMSTTPYLSPARRCPSTTLRFLFHCMFDGDFLWYYRYGVQDNTIEKNSVHLLRNQNALVAISKGICHYFTYYLVRYLHTWLTVSILSVIICSTSCNSFEGLMLWIHVCGMAYVIISVMWCDRLSAMNLLSGFWKHFYLGVYYLSLIHIWRCRRSTLCRSRWSPYH